MIWRKGKKAPEAMMREAAVVHGNTAYFTPANSVRVYSYQNILRNEHWSRLPDNPYKTFSLAVIDGLLTSVGGYDIHYVNTNTLLSLTAEDEWSEVFPPMPTPRSCATCITTNKALVVAGGKAGGYLATVEVMDINTKQWATVCHLPHKMQQSKFSGILCGGSLYLAGSKSHRSRSKSVFTCSLSDLLQTKTVGSRIQQLPPSPKSNVWKEVSGLPFTDSTLASFGGDLLAIGGEDDSGNLTADVYRYSSDTDSWHVISQMVNKRSLCFTITLPEERLIVVGGFTKLRGLTGYTASVEMLEDK